MLEYKLLSETELSNDDWDKIVDESDNGTIFHKQKFLSYHPSDRFINKSIIIYKNNKPLALFDAKESDCNIAKTGLYFSRQLSIPYFQVVRNCHRVEIFPDNCAVLPAPNFLMMTG